MTRRKTPAWHRCAAALATPERCAADSVRNRLHRVVGLLGWPIREVRVGRLREETTRTNGAQQTPKGVDSTVW